MARIFDAGIDADMQLFVLRVLYEQTGQPMEALRQAGK